MTPPWASTRPACDGEAEADALRSPRRLGAIEAVEDERQVDGVDPGAAVGDRERRPRVARAVRAPEHRLAVGRRAVGRGDDQRHVAACPG